MRLMLTFLRCLWKASHDVEVRGDIDPWANRDTAVLSASLARAGSVSHMVDETESILRRQLQQIPARDCPGGRQASKPVEVGISTGFWDVGAAHQKRGVVVIYLVQKGCRGGYPVQRPAHGAWERVAIDMRRHAIAVRGDNPSEVNVQEPDEAIVSCQLGLLVPINLIAEQKIERRGVIPPRTTICGSRTGPQERENESHQDHDAVLHFEPRYWS